MKLARTILMFGLLLCSCSPSAPSAIDLVQAGKDTEWPNGYVVHIDKRQGNSLEGIRIRFTSADGETRTFTAHSGTVASGWHRDAADKQVVTLTLDSPTIQSATGTITNRVAYVVLHRPE